MGPIQTDYIRFKKCELLNNRILIGVHFGYSLTKFLCLNKNNSNELHDESLDHITFQYSIFNNDDVESGLKWLKENAFMPQDTTLDIHGTGVGYFKYKEKIESIFGVKCIHVNDNTSKVTGHKIAFEQIGIENLKYPLSKLDYFEGFENDMLNKTSEAMRQKIIIGNEKNRDSHFPCLICLCGSVLTYIYYDENGQGEYLGGIECGGKTFLGLTKCLLDSNNYNDIMDLAHRGSRSNADIQIKDVIDETIECPYGKFNPEMTLMPFGKCEDRNIGVENISKEDIAASLAYFYSSMILSNFNMICFRKKILKIYLSGNTFQSEKFRNYVHLKHQMSFFPIGLEIIILNSGFCTALGAMLMSGKDKKTFQTEKQ